MKKLSIVFLSLGIFLSCNKELEQVANKPFKNVVLESFTDNPSLKTKETQAIVENVKVFEDMLWFKDEDGFRKAEEVLTSFRDSEIDRFNELYVTYTMDELKAMTEEERDAFSDKIMAIEKKVGYSEVLVYEQFENKLKFISLRQMMNAQEKSFLSQNNPDWEQFPRHFIGYEPEQVLLNPHAEVRIGDIIYKFSEEGSYKVTDADYATVLSLRENILNAYKLRNVAMVEEETSGGNKVANDCDWNKYRIPPRVFNSNGTKSIEMRIGVSGSILKRFYSSTKNYRLVNGNWQNYSTGCDVTILGNRCAFNDLANPTYGYNAQVTSTVEYRVYNASKALNYSQMQGAHSNVEGIQSLSHLYW